MFDWLRKEKGDKPVTHAELVRALDEAQAARRPGAKAGRFICPETGKVLDDVSIRKYVQTLYPDVIPPHRNHDLARERKAALLAMAEEQEIAWGGSRPPGAAKGGV